MKMLMRSLLCLAIAALTGCLIAADAAPVDKDAKKDIPPAQSDSAGKIPDDLDKALQMPEGADRNKALSATGAAWAKKDPIVALTWALQTPKYFPIAQAMVGECGRSHGKTTADWIVQQKDITSRREFIGSIMHGLILTWARVDPHAAADWCAQAPKFVRQISFFSVGDAWIEKDTPGATAWAVGVEAEEDRMAAIDGVVLKWGRKRDIPGLTVWAKTLKHGDMLQAARTVDREWVWNGFKKDGVKDVAGLRGFLDQLSLSDAEKAEILHIPAAAAGTK